SPPGLRRGRAGFRNSPNGSAGACGPALPVLRGKWQSETDQLEVEQEFCAEQTSAEIGCWSAVRDATVSMLEFKLGCGPWRVTPGPCDSTQADPAGQAPSAASSPGKPCQRLRKCGCACLPHAKAW